MKKVLLSFYLIIPTILPAQEVITITMDNSPKIDMEAVRNINKGEFFRLKIDSLNTFLYSVKIDGQDLKIEPVNLPANLLSFVSFEGLASSIANLNVISETIIPDSTVEKIQKMILNKDLDNNYKKFLDAEELTKSNEVQKKLSAQKVIDGFILEYRTKAFSLDSLAEELNTLHTDVISLKSPLIYLKHQKEINNFSRHKAETYLNKFIDLRKDLQKWNRELRSVNSSFEGYVVANQEIITKNPNLKEEVEKIKKVKEEMSKFFQECRDVLSPENYENLNQTFATLINHQSFSYTSLPMQLIEDEKELKIEIVPNQEKSSLMSYVTKIRFPDRNPNIWGVTTGLYLTKNISENYSIKRRDTTITVLKMNEDMEEEEVEEGRSYYTLIDERTPKEEMGINFIVFRGFRLKEFHDDIKNVFFTIGLGAGLSISEKPKPRLFFSPGLAIGDKNKFTINAGGIYMFYDTLSNGYNTNIQYNTAPENFLVSDTQIRGFISIGYVIELGK